MNATSRFSLTCDELVRSIKLNNRSRAYELVDRLRETFAAAVYGRPKEQKDKDAPAR